MQGSRTFRIFVSSTFSDLKEERNALQKYVFPRLRELCQQHGCRFQAIDLRWGISSEAGYDQQTMKICLEEIARCQKTNLKPNFVILLGNRYGWRPLPYEIGVIELSRIEGAIPEPDLRYLKEWYVLDENAGVGAYYLKPREGDYRKRVMWAPVERRLREILKAAVVKTFGNYRSNLEKYDTSATEQEILFGALKAEKPEGHVHCFARDFAGLPEDKSAAEYIDLDEAGHFDTESQALLYDLKSRLGQKLGGNYHPYSVKWHDPREFNDYLDKLCSDVYTSLSGAILKEIEGLKTIDLLDAEVAEHRKFGEGRASEFYGSDRHKIVSTITDYLFECTSRSAMVLYGESDTDLSSVMAEVANGPVDDQTIIVERRIGVTPGSTDGRTLLGGLCQEISKKCGLDEYQMPKDYYDMFDDLGKLIREVKVKRLLIFLDRLDQFSPAGIKRDISWLPVEVPANVSLIVSTLPGNELGYLMNKLPNPYLIAIKPTIGPEGIRDRQILVGSIKDYLWNIPSHSPLVVYGESGSGKSSIMAKVAQSSADGKQAIIIERYLGTTPESSDGRALLRSICREISRKCGLDESKVTHDYRELSAEFRKQIQAVKVSRLFIFLDAIDQLTSADDARDLSWLPHYLPPNVSIVLSMLPDASLDLLKVRLPESNLLKIESMTKEDGAEVLRFLLTRSGRSLQPAQEKAVLDKFEANGLPLYLQLAGVEASHWRSYDGVPLLSSDVPGIIKSMLERLSSDSNHGKMIVSHSLGYIAATRHGLTEDELLDLLSADDEVFNEFIGRSFHTPPERRLPVIVWSRLFFDLEPYLTERSADGASLLSFYHRQFHEVIVSEYLNRENMLKRHNDLGTYFSKMPLKSGVGGVPNVRKVAELPYQQFYGNMIGDLETTLTDLYFIEAKFIAGKAYELMADFERAGTGIRYGPPITTAFTYRHKTCVVCPFCLTCSEVGVDSLGTTIDCINCDKKIKLNTFTIYADFYPPNKTRVTCYDQLLPSLSEKFVNFAYFVKEQLHILSQYPELTLQQAVNYPADSDVCRGAFSILHDRGEQWVDRINKPRQKSSCIMTIIGHMDQVWYCEFSPDGSRILSAGPHVIKIWDVKTGKESITLTGHTNITGCFFSPDGTLIASTSMDGTSKLWNSLTGQLHLTLKTSEGPTKIYAFSTDGSVMLARTGKALKLLSVSTGEDYREIPVMEYHIDRISSCALSPDCKQIAYGTYYGELVIFDLAKGETIHTIKGPFRSIKTCCFSPDGKKVLIAADEGTVKIWRVMTGKEYLTLTGHKQEVLACKYSRDGTQIITASHDDTVKLWDAETGRELRTFQGHTNWVYDCCFSPDISLIASCSSDDTIKIWKTNMDLANPTSPGHSNGITSCTISPDVTLIATSSYDTTVKIWDLSSGMELRTLEGHSGSVYDCAFSPDNSWLATCSYNGTVKLWVPTTGKLIKTIPITRSGLRSCALSPDGKNIVAGHSDSELTICDIEAGKRLNTLNGYTGWPPLRCQYSPDGKRIVTAHGSILKTWDAFKGYEVDIYGGYYSDIYDCSYFPDGSRIASVASDCLLKIWDTKSARVNDIFKGHSSRITACAVSGDGNYVLTGSIDKTIRLWDLKTGRSKVIFYTDDNVTGIAVDPAMRWLIIAGNTGNLYILHLQNYHVDYVLATPVRLYHHINHQWNEVVTVRCGWCGHTFAPTKKIIKLIRRNEFKAKNYDTIAKGREDLGDLHLCPHCNMPLRLTSFLVDGTGKRGRKLYRLFGKLW